MSNHKPPKQRECRYCGELRYPVQFHQGTQKCSECRMADDRIRRDRRRNRKLYACTDWKVPA